MFFYHLKERITIINYSYVLIIEIEINTREEKNKIHIIANHTHVSSLNTLIFYSIEAER
jgi:hypothetical protein